MKKGYEQTYEWVVNLLKDCDLSEAARRLDIPALSERELRLDFIGAVYSITHEGVELVSSKYSMPDTERGVELDYNTRSVLGYYVLSEADCNPVNDYCTLGYFSGGVFGGRADNKPNWMTQALRDAYGADYKKFEAAARDIGMRFEAQRKAGQYTWSYNLLPKIPVKVIYYEGDEDFPTDIQILFDKTAIVFFKFEPLAALQSCFISRFAAGLR
jgi:hypothetical protein